MQVPPQPEACTPISPSNTLEAILHQLATADAADVAGMVCTHGNQSASSAQYIQGAFGLVGRNKTIRYSRGLALLRFSIMHTSESTDRVCSFLFSGARSGVVRAKKGCCLTVPAALFWQVVALLHSDDAETAASDLLDALASLVLPTRQVRSSAARLWFLSDIRCLASGAKTCLTSGPCLAPPVVRMLSGLPPLGLCRSSLTCRNRCRTGNPNGERSCICTGYRRQPCPRASPVSRVKRGILKRALEVVVMPHAVNGCGMQQTLRAHWSGISPPLLHSH